MGNQRRMLQCLLSLCLGRIEDSDGMVTRGAGDRLFPAWLLSAISWFRVTARHGENSPNLHMERSDRVCQVHFAHPRGSYRLRFRATQQSGFPRDLMTCANRACENEGHRLQAFKWAKSLFLKNKTKTLYYGIILDLPKSCKENTEFPCTLDPASPHVNVIRDH